jgi:hypothetical protein
MTPLPTLLSHGWSPLRNGAWLHLGGTTALHAEPVDGVWELWLCHNGEPEFRVTRETAAAVVLGVRLVGDT